MWLSGDLPRTWMIRRRHVSPASWATPTTASVLLYKIAIETTTDFESVVVDAREFSESQPTAQQGIILRCACSKLGSHSAGQYATQPDDFCVVGGYQDQANRS